MAYGEIKVDTITFTDGGIDKSVTISGLVQNPTFSGNITVTGTISGNTVRGQTISGVTVTGTTAQFTSGTFTTITGGVATITSGVFASGNAAGPSVSVGTTTNGIYSPATNQIAIATSGTGRLFVDSSGRVGIGTSSPGATLDVGGNQRFSAASPVLEFNNGGPQIFLPGANTLAFATGGGIGTPIERARIDSSGRLLVGTSSIVLGSPQTIVEKTSSDIDLFRVQCGATETAGNIAGLSFGHGPNGSRPKTAIGAVATGSFGLSNLVFYVDSTADNNSVSSSDEKMRIDTSGRVGIGTSSPLGNLHIVSSTSTAGWQVRVNGVGLSNESGFYRTASDNYEMVLRNAAGGLSYLTNTGGASSSTLEFVVQGSERARFASGGNFGIGTTTPNALLHVAGVARIGANDTSDAELQIGMGATGNRNSYIDLVGDTTYTDYGLRLIRTNGGANGESLLAHRGTNVLYLNCEDAGSIGFKTNSLERARIDSSGRLLVGTSSDSGGALFQVNGDRIRVGTAKTPASATATGTAGEICWDASYVYVCTGTNTWKRSALSTW